MKPVLDIGCGIRKPAHHYGMDINPKSDADIIHDLNEIPWPLKDNSFEEVHCHAILEHLPDFYGVMEEIWRVSVPDALVYIDVPHHTDTAAYTDPTHVNYLSTYTFEMISDWNTDCYYLDAQYEIKSMKVRLLKLYKVLLIESLVNVSIKYKTYLEFVRKTWENYLSFIVRGKTIEVVMQVKK